MILINMDTPTEGLLHSQPNTQCYVNTRCLGAGDLYIAESRICWKSSTSSQGLSLDYPHIAVHAVCGDTTQLPQKHLYLMVDIDLLPEDNESSDDEDNADPEPKSTSVRLVPADESCLQTLYDSISMGQLNHPPSDIDDDDEDEGEYELEGPTPGLRYGAGGGQFEDVMENGLGEQVHERPMNGHADEDDEEMEQ